MLPHSEDKKGKSRIDRASIRFFISLHSSGPWSSIHGAALLSPVLELFRIMAARLTGAHGLVAQVDDLALTVVTDVRLPEDTGKAQRTDRPGPGEFSIIGRLAVQTLP